MAVSEDNISYVYILCYYRFVDLMLIQCNIYVVLLCSLHISI